MCKVIAISNQKGGCGKTSVTANLGVGLAMTGKKVCLIDADPQGSLTISLGYPNPDEIPLTLATIMMTIIDENELPEDFGILHHKEGVDLIPANMELSGKKFCEHVKNEIKGFLPSKYADYHAELHVVSKPNIGERIGLTFVPPISGFPAPVVYLEPYFDAYMKGMNMGRIMVQIGTTAAEGIEKGREKLSEMMDVVPDMTDWNRVKDLVTVRVIGVSRNTELLQDIPCRLHGDIALIYQVSMTAPDNTLMTVRITNDLMDRYGITEPQLYDAAMENSQRMQKVTCRPMGEVIGDLMGLADDPIVDEAPAKLYVLSTESLQFGAAALFYPGVIEKLGKNIPEGFYILPSSIHEVLILPKNQGEKAMLETMVQEINATQVAPDEVLSDYVSEYDPRTRTMEWGKDPNLALPEKLQEKPPKLPSDVIL